MIFSNTKKMGIGFVNTMTNPAGRVRSIPDFKQTFGNWPGKSPTVNNTIPNQTAPRYRNVIEIIKYLGVNTFVDHG